jgi:hypothetical protein
MIFTRSPNYVINAKAEYLKDLKNKTIALFIKGRAVRDCNQNTCIYLGF